MKKNLLLFMYFLITFTGYAQVGIGTNTPNGALEVTSGENAKLGLVLPIVAKFEDVENTIAGEPVKIGTTVFDEQRNTICYKKNNGWSCLNGEEIPTPSDIPLNNPTYIKSSNTSQSNRFGFSTSLSADGNTLAVGVPYEGTMVGAVYIFKRNGEIWTQEYHITPPNPEEILQYFGKSISLSADGNTLAIGAPGMNFDTDLTYPGTVYIFKRYENTWTQETFLIPEFTRDFLSFGNSLSLSADGNTLAIGIQNFDSDEIVSYIFTRNENIWTQEAYLQTGIISKAMGITLSADGSTLAVGISGFENNSGIVYVYTRNGNVWTEQTNFKASNTKPNQNFGSVLAFTTDGNTLAVGAPTESSNSTTINQGLDNTDAPNAGAVYIFTRDGTNWIEKTYLKASNTKENQYFGYAISFSADGNKLAVGADSESSNSTTINQGENNTEAPKAGAVYLFTRNGTNWSQKTYFKAPNAKTNHQFGYSVSLSADGNTLAIGADRESSNSTTINQGLDNTDAPDAGAVYIYKLR